MITDPFVAQLASLCRDQRLVAKWVIVPTHAVGRTLGERLALEGVDWVNLRFVTPFQLALDTAAPWLLEQGLDPLPEDLGPALAMRLLLERPDDAPSYFRPLADQPQMGAALWRAIHELRMVGLSGGVGGHITARAQTSSTAPLHARRDPGALPAGGKGVACGTRAGSDMAPNLLPREAFEDERKHAELSALLESYEQHLATTRQADAADVYRAALTHAASSPIAPADIVIEAPYNGAVAPLVRAFLDALPGTRLPAAVPEVPGLVVPRRMRGVHGTPKGVPYQGAPYQGASYLGFLLAPGDAPANHRPDITLFHAAGREAEVESVLRRILTAGIPLDRVEIVCAAADAAPIFWEKAQRLELPITSESGVPATATRPARAVLALCDWIDAGFPATRLRRLLQAGDLRIVKNESEGEPPLSSAAAARLLVRSEATWGRDTYQRSLAALAARHRAEAEDPEESDEAEREAHRKKADDAEWLASAINRLLQLVPEPAADGTVSLFDVLNGFATVAADYLPVAGPLDVSVVASIRDGLTRLRALEGFRCTPRQALSFVRDAVTRLSVNASRPRPGHLHLSTLASAGHSGRPFTFIVGLEEGLVFPALIEDPVLLDAERAALHGALATSHDRLQEAIAAAIQRLAVLPVPANGADGGITFSYSCRDLRDGRETSPSWLMLQALRLKTGKPESTYADLQAALSPTPDSLLPSVPDQALTEAGWWVASLRGVESEAGTAAVLKAFPQLNDGVVATDSRASDRFTEFDGFVPAAAALLDPRRSDRGVSVTRLERLVACPYRYFLEHALGVEVPDEDPDRDEWLDRMQRGSLLHAIYARLSREARARGKRLAPTRDAARARQIADEELAACRESCPPPSELVFERERDEVRRDVELFLDFEAEREGCEPVAFEVAFGHGSDGGEEALAQAEPVEISLGQGQRVLLRGTIDRINRLADGTYEVSDYKTGRFWAPDYQGTFKCGALLQHALYGLAAAKLLRRLEPKPRVVQGAYEFPSAKGGGERVTIAAPSKAAITRVLSDLFDVMGKGLFLPAREAKTCEWCDFKRACDAPTEAAAEKLENEDNRMLEAYRRLLEHE